MAHPVSEQLFIVAIQSLSSWLFQLQTIIYPHTMLRQSPSQTRNRSSFLPQDSSSRYAPKRKDSPSNIRVLRTHLVYVIGLSPQICSQTLLSSEEYFGKYGTVLKVAINKRPNMSRKQASYSAVVTFEDEISASLAVVSLFEFKYSDTLLRCCYGCSKYCETFFYGRECRKPSCYYLHHFDPHKEIHLDSSDKDQDYDFDRHYKMALDIVYDTLPLITADFKGRKLETGVFPDPYGTLRTLVDKDYLTEEEYEKEWDCDVQKCNTESTEPLKEESEGGSEEFGEQQKVQEQSVVLESSQSQIYNRIMSRIQRKSNLNKLKSRMEFVDKVPCSPRFVEALRSFFGQEVPV